MKHLRRWFAALLALILAAPATAAPAMWRFGDADTTIYLYGTIHALPPGYQWRDAKLEEVLASADTLVIETLIDKDPAAVAKLFPAPDPTLPPIVERVPAKSQTALTAMIAKAGLSPQILDRMPTWQAAFMLMGAMMRDIGADRSAGVEQSLTPVFETGAVPRRIEGLETVAEQLALFSGLSEADQRELLTGMIDGSGDAKRDFAKMLRAWGSGNEKAIARAFEKDEDLTPHLREVLLRKRNAAWAAWLKDRLATPGTVLVAVGAGHLAGPLSVQSMLAAEGVTVERVR